MLPPLRSYSKREREQKNLKIAPFTLMAELPCATTVVDSALELGSATKSWQMIATGALSTDRIQALMRAHPIPSTFVCRTLPKGMGMERGGAGVAAPLVELVNRKLELRGKQLRKIQGSSGMKISELPPKSVKLAETLLSVGGFILD